MGNFTIRVSEIIDLGETIFLPATDANRYPIFDEAYRADFEKKIIDHYMNYEIGQETIGMWRFALNRKMREIMPYYNQLYKSTLLTIDPLATVNYSDDATTHNTGSATTDSTGTNSSTTNSQSRGVTSETPQTLLSGNEDYASGATDAVGQTTVTGTSGNNATQNSSGDGTISRNVTGSQGHQATLLMQYRKSLLNIDMNVISELESLFMMVWDNGDEFTRSEGFSYVTPFGWFGSL
jgi:hypothetical protein